MLDAWTIREHVYGRVEPVLYLHTLLCSCTAVVCLCDDGHARTRERSAAPPHPPSNNPSSYHHPHHPRRKLFKPYRTVETICQVLTTNLACVPLTQGFLAVSVALCPSNPVEMEVVQQVSTWQMHFTYRALTHTHTCRSTSKERCMGVCLVMCDRITKSVSDIVARQIL